VTDGSPVPPDPRRGAPMPPDAVAPEPGAAFGSVGFRARLTLGLIVAGVLPVAGFGLVVLVVAGTAEELGPTLTRILLFTATVAVVFAILVAYLLAESLSRPLRVIARAVERTSAGDLSTRIDMPGDDEFSRLADSHNRLAADLARRNHELRRILEAIEETTIRERPEAIAERAAGRARAAFGMIDAEIRLGDPRDFSVTGRVPGEPRPVYAVLTASGEPIGVLAGHLPATRSWERADQDLLDLYASEVAAAIRNGQLFARVEDQNVRLTELDAAKDDFLRGVSHNLQTPLASIRAYADQLAGEHPDRRLGIITEQADRLSRMVRQLLTVSRIESGALRARPEVLAIGPRIRRTWEALGVADVPFTLDDRAGGWLAIADADQLDQVLWAVLDNAVSHGGRTPVTVEIVPDAAASELRVSIADLGPGVTDADGRRLFGRYERGTGGATEGSGLGLYVSRELCRAMGGELELRSPTGAPGAVFTIRLPAEHAEET
jgi:signal transduction histidine kinase/HAMP domain-containing protein